MWFLLRECGTLADFVDTENAWSRGKRKKLLLLPLVVVVAVRLRNSHLEKMYERICSSSNSTKNNPSGNSSSLFVGKSGKGVSGGKGDVLLLYIYRACFLFFFFLFCVLTHVLFL